MRYLVLTTTVILLIAGCNPTSINDRRTVTYRVDLLEGEAMMWHYFDPIEGMIMIRDEPLPWERVVEFHILLGDVAALAICPLNDSSTMSAEISCNGEVVASGEATGNETIIWYWTVE